MSPLGKKPPSVKEFKVGKDDQNHGEVRVTSDGVNAAVHWGCEQRRFTVEDLKDKLANLDTARHYEAWLFDEDSHRGRYTAGMTNGKFVGDTRHSTNADHTVDYAKFREALEKAVAVKPPKGK